MNEALRLLRRTLRPFGYDIRKFGAINLQPYKGIAAQSSLDGVRDDFDYDSGSERKVDANLDTLKIIYRTCLNEERNHKSHNKVTSMPLVDTVERCFVSLVKSVNAALEMQPAPRIEVLLLDDHSDAALLQRVLNAAKTLQCSWRLQTTEANGQGTSLHQQFSMARNDDALYYFCEDDYLHVPSAVGEMWQFYRQIYATTRRHLVLHPQEHEGLYAGSYYPSYLMLSPHRHWRSVSDMTHIFLTHAHLVRDYWSYFENTRFVGNRKKRHLGSESKTTNRLFQHVPGFVPIPALAGHLQAISVLPPFFDWKSLWDTSAPD